jgi:hypothetical protein
MSDSFAPTDKVNPVTLAFPCIPRKFIRRFKAFLVKTFGSDINFWYEGGDVDYKSYAAIFVWFYPTQWENFPPELRKIFLDIAAGESVKLYYDGDKFLHVRKSNYPEHNQTNTLVTETVPETVVTEPETVPETEPEIEFGV